MRNSVVEDINEQIKSYGSNQYGDPIFRVVFSDDQTEKRKGTFNDYHGKIFVRSITEVREVKKYPWIKRKWILEKWADGVLSYHPDLVSDKNGVFVCVYVFQDANQNYLPPLLKVAQIIINNLLHPRNKDEAIMKDKEIEKKKEKAEIDKIEKELKIQSDESASKDKKSHPETSSVGYTKDMLREDK